MSGIPDGYRHVGCCSECCPEGAERTGGATPETPAPDVPATPEELTAGACTAPRRTGPDIAVVPGVPSRATARTERAPAHPDTREAARREDPGSRTTPTTDPRFTAT